MLDCFAWVGSFVQNVARAVGGSGHPSRSGWVEASLAQLEDQMEEGVCIECVGGKQAGWCGVGRKRKSRSKRPFGKGLCGDKGAQGSGVKWCLAKQKEGHRFHHKGVYAPTCAGLGLMDRPKRLVFDGVEDGGFRDKDTLWMCNTSQHPIKMHRIEF